MRALMVLATAAAIAGCSSQEAGSPGAESGSEAAESPRSGAPAALAVTLPKLAYAYTLRFLLPEDRIAAAQDAHAALCAQMGPERCQLLTLERGSGDTRDSRAVLSLRVATDDARRFSEQIGRSVSDAGGRTADTKVAAEDVSKAMVDTEARIRQRELLVARLTEVLRTRNGKVGDLLEAERSIGKAQEELDQARGWLTALRGRVAMSRFDLSYAATAPATSAGAIATQLGEAAQGSGALFLWGLRELLTLALYLLPWALLIAPFAVWRHAHRRRGALHEA